MTDSAPNPSVAWLDEDLEHLERCPVCGSQQTAGVYDSLRDIWFAAAPGDWALHECGACGSAFLSPRPTPHSIGRAYASYYTHADVPSARLSWPRRLWASLRQARLASVHGTDRVAPGPGWARLAARGPVARLVDHTIMRDLPPARPGDRLLDVGCGAGGYLLRARDLGWDVMGIEPDPLAARQAQALGLTVFEGSFDAWLTSPLAQVSAPFTRITLNHVLEHVHDPAALLSGCRRHLHPQGRLWIETPNWASSSRRRAARHWRGLEPPRHLVLFTPSSLMALLKDCGLVTARWSYNPLAAWSLARAQPLIGPRRGAVWPGAIASLTRLLVAPPRDPARYDEPFLTLEAVHADPERA